MAKSGTEKQFEDQLDDEEVLLVFRKHPVVMRKGLIVSMLVILLGVVPSLFRPDFVYFYGGLFIGLIVSGLVFLPFWISWYYSVYIVTDQRLLQIKQKGFWNRSVVDISLSQIQMVNYQVAGFQQTTLGFGTIMMQTYVGDLVVHDVHHPEKTQKKILEILRDKGVISVSPPQKKNQENDETS